MIPTACLFFILMNTALISELPLFFLTMRQYLHCDSTGSLVILYPIKIMKARKKYGADLFIACSLHWKSNF
jgi:hypothetical protein